jgi:tetratricopeptide (TPR) repeat protein
MNRRIAWTFLAGASLGLAGCQSPMFGGLAAWNRSGSGVASTSPDVGKQKFGGLAQQADGASSGLGAARPANNDGFFMASWKKTTAAMTGGSTVKKVAVAPEDDPLRLDRVPRKIGPEVYVGAARLLEANGKFDEAEGKYGEALRAAPNDLNALVGLARLHDRQGRPQKAIETYQRAAQAHPGEALVFNDMGLCYRRQRQLDKSLLAFRKSVSLVPENAKYRNNLAAALVDAGRGDEAYEQLAIINSPAVAHYNLAFLLQQKGQRSDAIKQLREAISIDPALTPAHEMLAQLTGSAAPPPAVSHAAPQAASASEGRVATRPVERTAHQVPQRKATQPESREPVEDSAASGELPYSQASEPGIYTSAPQIDAGSRLPVAKLPQEPSVSEPQFSSYHIGDDNAAGGGTASTGAVSPSKWSSAWALPASEAPRSSHPLPPVDE